MSDREAVLVKGRLLTVADTVGIPLVSVGLAIAISSVIIWLAGFDPIAAFSALFDGAFGTPRQFGETMMRSTPLMFTGLAVAYGFRAGLFNIGAEGQLFMGGLVAAYIGAIAGGLPALLLVPLVLVAAGAAGAAWAFQRERYRHAADVVSYLPFARIALG